MKEEISKQLIDRELWYKDSDYFNDPVVGKEVVRFPFRSKKYINHTKKHLGDIYFDDFIMNELKALAEKNRNLCAPNVSDVRPYLPEDVDGDMSLYDFLCMLESKGCKIQIVDKNGKVISTPEVQNE